MTYKIGGPLTLKGGVHYTAHVNGREAVWPHDATIQLVAGDGSVLASFVLLGNNVKRVKVAADTTAQFQSEIETKNVTGSIQGMPVGSYVP